MNLQQRDMTGTATDERRLSELRRTRILLTGLFLIAVCAALYVARALILPVVLAIMLTLTLRPAVRALSRLNVPVGVSAFMLTFGASALIAVIIYSLSGPLGNMADRAPYVGYEIKRKIEPIVTQLSEVQEATEEIEEAARGGDNNKKQDVVIERPSLLGTGIANLASAGTSLVVALILTLFLLSSGDFFVERAAEVARGQKAREEIQLIVAEVEREVSNYLGTIALINAGLGVAVGAALWLMDVPYAHLWGIGAFILNFLPYVGAMIGVALLTVTTILTFDNIGYAMAPPVVYFVLTSIEGQFVTPMILGRSLSLNTVAVLLSVMLWVWLWGVAGAFLAVPILVLIKVFACHIDGWRDFGRFLTSRGDEPGAC